MVRNKQEIRVPRLCSRRLPSGRVHCYAKFSGRTVSFGMTDDPETEARYRRFSAEWIKNGQRLPIEPNQAPAAIIVQEVADRFEEHARGYYRCQATGAATSEVRSYRHALEPLRELYGTLPAAAFDSVKLRVLEDRWIRGMHRPREGEGLQSTLRSEDRPNPRCQVRQLRLHHVPHDLPIDKKVVVNQDVTKAGDLAPLDIGMGMSHFVGNPLRGFTNDLEVAHDRVDQSCAASIMSAKICSRSSDLMPSANTRSTRRPNRSSSKSFKSMKLSKVLRTSSTTKSRSLSGPAASRANDPNSPSLRTPRLRRASRLSASVFRMISRVSMTNSAYSSRARPASRCRRYWQFEPRQHRAR